MKTRFSTRAFTACLGCMALGLTAPPARAWVEPESLNVQVYEFANRNSVFIIAGTTIEIRLDEMRHVNMHWEIDHVDGTGLEKLSEEHVDKAVSYADMTGAYILKFNTVNNNLSDEYNEVVLKLLDDKGKKQESFSFRVDVRHK